MWTVLLGLAGLAIVYAIGSALTRGNDEPAEDAIPR